MSEDEEKISKRDKVAIKALQSNKEVREKWKNKANVSFVGLEEILKVVINYTHDESLKKSKEERFEKAWKILMGRPLNNKSGRKESENDVNNLFNIIREERLNSKKNGEVTPVETIVKKHIDKIKRTGTPESAVRYYSGRYNKEYRHLEDPSNLEKRRQADKAMLSLLENAIASKQMKIDEIFSCLQKNNWPI